MVRTISLQNAAGQLADLVRHLAPGDEILLTDGVHQLARIVPEPRPSGKRLPGACKGLIEILDDSNDEVLEHFKEYLP